MEWTIVSVHTSHMSKPSENVPVGSATEWTASKPYSAQGVKSHLDVKSHLGGLPPNRLA